MRALLFIAAMLLTFGTAHAGFAQLAPPPGVTSVGNVTTVAVGTAANGARYAGGHVMANASLQVGARAITVPVGYRVAANAAVFAATKLNPYAAGLSLAAAAIPFVVDFIAGDDIEVTPIGKLQVPGKPANDGIGKIVLPNGKTIDQERSALSPPAGSYYAQYADSCRITSNGPLSTRITLHDPWGGGFAHWCVPNGSAQPTPATPERPATEDDIGGLSDNPVNPALLPSIGEPIPVDPAPVINPTSEPSGDIKIGPNGNPAPVLQPGTLRVPDGNPVPVPNTSPQQYSQPWLEIIPAPTPSQPLRVEIRPVTTTTTSPTAPTDPVTNPSTPSTPNDSADPCRLNPESLMCQPIGDFTDPSMPSIPVLYERKYPQGMVGIWNEKSAALTQTSMVSVLNQMMPTHLTGGQCPSWTINLALGPSWADLGTHEVAPPCWLWDVAKAILIISALMAARRMIFGG